MVMYLSSFIAKRLKFRGNLAAICIAVSFLVMIVAVALSGGFRYEIRKGLSGIVGDIQIVPVNMNYIGGTSPIEASPAYMSKVVALPEIASITPVVYRPGIIKNDEIIHGVVFKGCQDQQQVALNSLEVSIPSRLAQMMGLKVGDTMTSYFVGEKVKARKFSIVDIYDSIVQADDKLIVYAPIEDLQRVNEWRADQVSAFEIELVQGRKDVRSISALTEEIAFLCYEFSSDEEETVVVTSTLQQYPQLFDWLNLIDFNVLFILILMTIVAGFNMISGLLIMLFENISTIGLLKSLGMTDRAITKVFLTASSRIVLKGMAWGNIVAFGFVGLQHFTHFFRLNPANYFVSYLPVHISLGGVLAADFGVYIVFMALLMLPSLFISKVDPAQTVVVK